MNAINIGLFQDQIMDSVDDKTFTHITSHILIRDKDTKAVLLNKNVNKPLRTTKGMENNQNE